jgi:hypothetical protein
MLKRSTSQKRIKKNEESTYSNIIYSSRTFRKEHCYLSSYYVNWYNVIYSIYDKTEYHGDSMKHTLIFFDGPLAGKKIKDKVDFEKGKIRENYIYTDETGIEYNYYMIQETEDKFCYSLLKKKQSNRKCHLFVIKQ